MCANVVWFVFDDARIGCYAQNAVAAARSKTCKYQELTAKSQLIKRFFVKYIFFVVCFIKKTF